MALYKRESSKPFVRYNAKAGRWYFQDEEVKSPVFVVDFESVKKAWMFYKEGQAPDVVEFPSIDAQVEKPSENHKLGLILNLYSEKLFGGDGVVEFSSNSSITCGAISDLYEEYEAGANDNKGKLPVVKAGDAEPISGQYGTNYKPVFTIDKWVDRPAAFDGAGEAPADSGSEF